MTKFTNLGLKIFFISLLLVMPFSAHANPVQKAFQEGMIAYGNGDYKKAIELFERTLQMYPKLHPSYNYIALSKKALGADMDEVIDLLNKAIEIKPDYAEPYENLSKIYYALGKFDLSLEKGLKSLELDPSSTSTMLTLAWTYLLGTGESEEAIYYFEEAIKSDNTPYTKFGLGMAYLQVDEKYKALDLITQLRGQKANELATKLETLIHQNQKLPKHGLKSFAEERPGQMTTSKGVLIEDNAVQQNLSNKTLSAQKMKVRLRQPVEEPQESPYGVNAPTLSGSERIRRLQNKGSSY